MGNILLLQLICLIRIKVSFLTKHTFRMALVIAHINKPELCSFGFSITGDDSKEPGCSTNLERFKTAVSLYALGFNVWFSFEPILNVNAIFGYLNTIITSNMHVHIKMGLNKYNNLISHVQVKALLESIYWDIKETNNKSTVYLKRSITDHIDIDIERYKFRPLQSIISSQMSMTDILLSQGFEYLTIDTTPHEEQCVQCVESEYNYPEMLKEAYAFISQLQRVYPVPDDVLVQFVVNKNSHDFGSYADISIFYKIRYDENGDELASYPDLEYALQIESHNIDRWDKLAMDELTNNKYKFPTNLTIVKAENKSWSDQITSAG